MNAIIRFEAALLVAGAFLFCSMSANASWWNSDDDYYYDRWHGGPWYGAYPGYGWGGYPGYGYRGGYGWGGYPGYGQGKTVIVMPQVGNTPDKRPEPRLPR